MILISVKLPDRLVSEKMRYVSRFILVVNRARLFEYGRFYGLLIGAQ